MKYSTHRYFKNGNIFCTRDHEAAVILLRECLLQGTQMSFSRNVKKWTCLFLEIDSQKETDNLCGGLTHFELRRYKQAVSFN